jgi:oligopeptidase B
LLNYTTVLEKFGDVRVDNYFLVKDRENPEVIDYLHKENDYMKNDCSHAGFQKNCLRKWLELRKTMNQFLIIYITATITRFETGKDYPIYSRKKESLSAKEELCCNGFSKGKIFQVEWIEY